MYTIAPGRTADTILATPEWITPKEYTPTRIAPELKFRKQIVPGDRVDIEATLLSLKRGLAKGHAEATVNGEFAYSCDLQCGLPDVMKEFRPTL